MRTASLEPGALTRTPSGRAGARVVAALRAKGHGAWLAGGCVRDALLGKEAHDVDVATSARPEEVRGAFEKVVDTGIRFGTVTVLLDGEAVQVTTFRSESGYADGRRPSSVSFGATLEE